MSWDAYHRRRRTVREALNRAAQNAQSGAAETCTKVSGAALLRELDPNDEVFGTETEFLLDVQLAWYQCLSGELDRSRHLGSRDLDILTARAWAQAAAEMPGARALLDPQRDNPDLARALANENALLASSAGLRVDASAAGHARKIREHAATMHVVSRRPAPRPGIIARMRGARAA